LSLITLELEEQNCTEYKRVCECCKENFTTIEELVFYCSEKCKGRMNLNICYKCDKEFYSYAKRKYCSDNCKKENCVVCNKVYIKKNAETYCSEECADKLYSFKCKACEKDFVRRGAKKAAFCSTQCSDIYNKSKKERKLCRWCKRVITVTNLSILYCSDECRINFYEDKERKRNNRDNGNALYEDVKEKVYLLIDKRNEAVRAASFQSTVDFNLVSGFTESLKSDVRRRDGNQCFICDKKSGLEVHHILPRKLGGSHDPNNLITLCIKCHRHIETGDKNHAVQKCYKNAMIYFKNPIDEYREPISKSEQITFLEKELNKVYEKLVEINTYEFTEILVDMDNLFDELNELRKLK
jgi:hypothetical protein